MNVKIREFFLYLGYWCITTR